MTIPNLQQANSFAVQSDGKIVIGLLDMTGFFTMRLTAAGTPDSSYGPGGIVRQTGEIDGYLYILPNNKILDVGSVSNNMAVERLNSNGTLDATFGTHGVSAGVQFKTAQGAPAVSFAGRVTVDSQGNLLLGGESETVSQDNYDLAVARLTPTGAVDLTFGNAGAIPLPMSARDGGTSTAIMPDGSIIAGGGGLYQGAERVQLVRIASAKKPAMISGKVFKDANSNGALDSAETGIAGRTIFIDANKNGKLDTGETKATTSANGSFSFSALAAGTYRITDVLPAGWRRTAPTVGYFDVTVAAGQIVTGKNFAETQNVLISGSIFNDANGNAKQDTGEKGIAGRTVYIDKNKNGKFDVGEPSTVTASDGSYSFKTLLAGSYRARQVLPAGSRSTSPTAGYYDLTLTSGQSATTKDFAETTTSLLSGVVFKDANSNAKQDAGELGLAGWVVYLDTNNNGKLDAGEKSFTTGADGKFSFVVPAGTYHLREVLKSGFTRTTPAGGLFTP